MLKIASLALTPPVVLKAVSVAALAITATVRLWHHGVLGPAEKMVGERS